jgi:hypothetical protein
MHIYTIWQGVEAAVVVVLSKKIFAWIEVPAVAAANCPAVVLDTMNLGAVVEAAQRGSAKPRVVHQA